MSTWKIKDKSRDSLDYDTPSTNTVQSDSLTAIERFVREIIGNSRDSQLDNGNPVRVEFSLMDIDGNEKAQFLSSTKLDLLKNSFEVLERKSENISRIFHGKKPTENLYNPGKKLRILTIRDTNTKGLIGPEYPTPENEGKGDLRFIGLCRSTGKNSTADGQDSTGSWGYGKSVIWANNMTRIVMFNSKLSEPASYEGTEINQRLFGHALFPDFMEDNHTGKDGKVFFGNVSNNEVLSIWNNEALDFVENVDMEDFKTPDSGTSIMIVGFEPGDGDEYSSATIINQLKDAVAKYFWPAIISKELEVTVKHNDESTEVSVERNPDYSPFIRAFKKVMNNPSSDDRNYQLIDAIGPVSMDSFDGKIALYAREVEQNPPPLVNKIAKIRGTKMVIEYSDPKITGVSGVQTIGVALAGSLINHLNNVNSQYQNRLDTLLRESEPISHHKWDHTNQKLKQHRAKNAVQKINKDIVKFFRKMVKDGREEPMGEYSTMLSQIFNIGGSGSGPGPRGGETEYRTLKNMEKDIYEQHSKYIHRIAFKTKPKANYRRVEGNLQVTHIGFSAKFFAVDESGTNLKDFDSLLSFKPVEVKSTTYEDDNYQQSVESSTLSPLSIYEPIALDSKYREYEVEFHSDKIPNEVFGIFIIRPSFVWQLGREQ